MSGLPKSPHKFVIFFCALNMITFSSALAGWTLPIRISDGGAYMPRIDYSDGVIHVLYESSLGNIYYVRSADNGVSWSAPYWMMRGDGQYPQIHASGDSVVAIWEYEPRSYYYNIAIKKSTDGGLTWSDSSNVLPAENRDQLRYSFCISGRKIFVAYTRTPDVLFKRSTDWGATWSNSRQIISLQYLNDPQIRNFGDSLFLIVDGESASGETNEVYFLRSYDGGMNWTAPEIISADDSLNSYYSAVAINEEGKITVCWKPQGGGHHGEILFRLSDDFGQTWGPIIENAQFSIWGEPIIARTADSIHIVSGGFTYITHTVSTDAGASWAEVDTVENSRYGSLDPAMALTPGKVHVIWDDGNANFPGIYYSRWEEGYIPPDSSAPELQIIGGCALPYWNGWDPTICVRGDYAYVGYSPYQDSTGIKVIDISNPANPHIVNAFDTDYYPTEMVIDGDYIYIAHDGSRGPVTYNIADPMNPIFVSVGLQGADLSSLCKQDSLIYAPYSRFLLIYNYANPLQPGLIERFDPPGPGYFADIDVSDGRCYLMAGGLLYIIDVSNPESPYRLSAHAIDYGASQGVEVEVRDEYAYVISTLAKVEILNVSDPVRPFRAGIYYLNYGPAFNICIHNNYLVIAHGDVTVADISNPASPATLAEYTGPTRFYDVDADDQYIYANGEDTFMVFRMPVTGIDDDESALPRKAALSQNFPNPFNTATTIQYNLPSPARLTIEIFDILGRKIETLIDEHQTAGRHSIVWNGKNNSSGIYFYRIQAGDYSETKKMVLLR